MSSVLRGRLIAREKYLSERRMSGQEIAKPRMLLQECRIANRLGVLHKRPLEIGLGIEHFPDQRDIRIAQRPARLP